MKKDFYSTSVVVIIPRYYLDMHILKGHYYISLSDTKLKYLCVLLVKTVKTYFLVCSLILIRQVLSCNNVVIMYKCHVEIALSVVQKDPSENLYRKRKVLLLLLLLFTNSILVSKKRDLLDFLISLIRLNIISVS